jgi:hypothetical protein
MFARSAGEGRPCLHRDVRGPARAYWCVGVAVISCQFVAVPPRIAGVPQGYAQHTKRRAVVADAISDACGKAGKRVARFIGSVLFVRFPDDCRLVIFLIVVLFVFSVIVIIVVRVFRREARETNSVSQTDTLGGHGALSW